MKNLLETDYLIVGSGAVGMAFADTMLTESESDLIIVDEHHKPGGHWNLAYPFVTLHQPSAFYGVNSRELGTRDKDQVGLNKGLSHLASGAEVSAYFDEVMKQQFLPSGRVRYFPMCRYIGDGKFVSIMSGKEFNVEVSKKIVDATYLKTSVPSNHTPSFTIEQGVRFCPPNDLPFIKDAPSKYVVIGGGKTGIDSCLWLLEQGVSAERIDWIVSRDAWLVDRQNTQSTEEFFEQSIGAQAAQMESIANAETIEDMFDRLEACGYFLRIDKNFRPSMFHGATISQLELELLRKIKNIIRLGRVIRLENDKIIFEKGQRATDQTVLHVDCSASAIPPDLAKKPIFEEGLITPQTVRSYQPVFSAAMVAFVEANYDSDSEKNILCNVVPLPNADIDFLQMTMMFMMNQKIWSERPEIQKWLYQSRLDGFSQLVKDVKPEDKDKVEILQRLRQNVVPAVAKLQQFIAQTMAS